MTPKLRKDLSASTIQVVINQVLGLLVFLLTSYYLPKEIYGELNWTLAILMFATTVLSLRLEQIVVREAAAEKDTAKVMTLFFVHVVLSGLGFYLLLLLLNVLFPAFFSSHSLLLLLGISQLLGFFASPFKQVANGKEQFEKLALMSSIANLVRSIGLFICIIFFQLTIDAVVMIFIISSVVELMVCFWLVTMRMQVKLVGNIRFADYVHLLKGSIPQIGAAILIAGISRMDWILLGFFSTASLTAEYSFAYRVYELSPVPLLIIAPILLSRFSRFFVNNSEEALVRQKVKLSLLIRAEMIVATFIPLVLNIIWTPVIDAITGDKYGAVNQTTFLILSCCIPFQYISNILWSAHFAQNRLRLILKVTFTMFCVILLGDLLLIPYFDVKAAAVVYLFAIITEYIIYMRTSVLGRMKEMWLSLVICLAAAAISGVSAFYLFDTTLLRIGFAIILFFLLVLATRQWQKSDTAYVLQLVRKKTNP